MNNEFMKSGNKKFCHECGENINYKAEICPKCGVRQANQTYHGINEKSKTIAALFAFFLGGLGFHKFYLGEIFAGVFYLLLCWTFIPAFVALIEGILLLIMSDEKFNRKYGSVNYS